MTSVIKVSTISVDGCLFFIYHSEYQIISKKIGYTKCIKKSRGYYTPTSISFAGITKLPFW